MAQKHIQIGDGYYYAGITTSNALTIERTLTSLGAPVVVNSIGTTTIYTPSAGKSIKLKWFAMASSDTNTATVIATVTLGDNDIYIWPMCSPGAFMHSSIREGAPDGILTVTLSAAQTVYVNIDVEEF